MFELIYLLQHVATSRICDLWISPPYWIRYSTRYIKTRHWLRTVKNLVFWIFARCCSHNSCKAIFFQCKTWLKVSWKWMVWKNLFLTCYMMLLYIDFRFYIISFGLRKFSDDFEYPNFFEKFGSLHALWIIIENAPKKLRKMKKNHV